MAENNPTTETVRQLVALVVEHGLAELTVEEDGVVITVKGAAAAAPVAEVALVAPVAIAAAVPSAVAAPVAVSVAAAKAPASTTPRTALEAPMVGIFYHSPSPEDPPYVNVGDQVRVGQTIGLIEAMKTYSEVPAEIAGRVVEVAASNGVLVQQGQPLYYVE